MGECGGGGGGGGGAAFDTIAEVIADLKAKETRTMFTQTTTPEANKMEESLLCACRRCD